MTALRCLVAFAILALLGIFTSSILHDPTPLYVLAVPAVICLLAAFYFEHREGKRQ